MWECGLSRHSHIKKLVLLSVGFAVKPWTCGKVQRVLLGSKRLCLSPWSVPILFVEEPEAQPLLLGKVAEGPDGFCGHISCSSTASDFRLVKRAPVTTLSTVASRALSADLE